MKSGNSPTVGGSSGSKPESPQRMPLNIHRGVGSIKPARVPGLLSIEDCSSACEKDTKCYAYSYNKAKQDDLTGECLKYSSPEQISQPYIRGGGPNYPVSSKLYDTMNDCLSNTSQTGLPVDMCKKEGTKYRRISPMPRLKKITISKDKKVQNLQSRYVSNEALCANVGSNHDDNGGYRPDWNDGLAGSGYSWVEGVTDTNTPNCFTSYNKNDLTEDKLWKPPPSPSPKSPPAPASKKSSSHVGLILGITIPIIIIIIALVAYFLLFKK